MNMTTRFESKINHQVNRWAWPIHPGRKAVDRWCSRRPDRQQGRSDQIPDQHTCCRHYPNPSRTFRPTNNKDFTLLIHWQISANPNYLDARRCRRLTSFPITFLLRSSEINTVAGGRKEGAPGGTEVGWLLVESEEMVASSETNSRTGRRKKENETIGSHIDAKQCKRHAGAFASFTNLTSLNSFTSLGSVLVRRGLGIFHGTAFTNSVVPTTAALTSTATTSDTQRQLQRHKPSPCRARSG